MNKDQRVTDIHPQCAEHFCSLPAIERLSGNTIVDAGGSCPNQYHHCHNHTDTCNDLVKKTFPLSLLIPQKEAKNHAGTDPASVAPVVDTWHQEAEEKESKCPAANLSKNGLSIRSSPALTIVEGGTNQGAYCGGGTDGEAYACQVRD